MTTFLQAYAGKTAETFGGGGGEEEVERSVPGAFESSSLLRNRASQISIGSQATIVPTEEQKELEIWFDAEGTKIQVWCDDCGKKVGGLRFKCLDVSFFSSLPVPSRSS